jgi:hypothetical protein
MRSANTPIISTSAAFASSAWMPRTSDPSSFRNSGRSARIFCRPECPAPASSTATFAPRSRHVSSVRAKAAASSMARRSVTSTTMPRRSPASSNTSATGRVPTD